MKREFQKREITSIPSIREDGGKRTIVGFIPYNSRSQYMGFYEYIMPTAFNKTLADQADVRALMNHDTSKLLGRVKNGSLKLESREDGLYIECQLPETSYADDAYNLIRDGLNTGLSFGFNIINEDYGIEDGVEVHYLREVKLEEVSFCVSFPAYEETNSVARNVRGINITDLEQTLEKEQFEEQDYSRIQNYIDQLRELLPQSEPAQKPENTEAAKSTSAAEEREQFYSEILKELRKLKTN